MPDRPSLSHSKRDQYLAELGNSKCYRHDGRHTLIECDDSSLDPGDRTEADDDFDRVNDSGEVSNDRVIKAWAHGVPPHVVWRIARDYYITGWYDGSGKDIRSADSAASIRKRERELYEAAMRETNDGTK